MIENKVFTGVSGAGILTMPLTSIAELKNILVGISPDVSIDKITANVIINHIVVLWQWDATSTLQADDITVVQSNNITTGRWIAVNINNSASPSNLFQIALKEKINYIINSNMDINNSYYTTIDSNTLTGYKGSPTTLLKAKYLVNRFFIEGTSCWIAVHKDVAISDPVYSLFQKYLSLQVVTSDSNNDGYTRTGQRIEYVNTVCDDYVTISFYAKANVNASVNLRVNQITNPLHINDIVSSTPISLTTAFTKHVVTLKLPSLQNMVIDSTYNCIEVALEIENGTRKQAITLDYSCMQVVNGMDDIPKIPRLSASDLSLCDRYYMPLKTGMCQNMTGNKTWAWDGFTVLTANISMRNSPTCLIYGWPIEMLNQTSFNASAVWATLGSKIRQLPNVCTYTQNYKRTNLNISSIGNKNQVIIYVDSALPSYADYLAFGADSGYAFFSYELLAEL